MIGLLRKPFGSHGKVHEITPSSAGWRYVGFSLWRLRVGETVSEATGDHEVILVMVEGKVRLAAAGRDWGVLGERMNVFDKTPPHCLYLPSDAEWKAIAENRLRDRRLFRAGKRRARSAPHRTGRHHAHRARQGRQHAVYKQYRHGERGLLRQPPRDRGFHAGGPLVLLPEPQARRG
jgi:5-deoxy-D-glucuronate isomerase